MRDRYRAKLAKLSTRRAALLKRTTAACRATRARVGAEAKAYRARERERINAEVREMRDKAKRACNARRARIRAMVKDEAKRERQLHDAEARRARELAGVERKRVTMLRKAETRRKARERAQESDAAVLANIDPELAPLWHKVKRQIRGGPHRSRTEAFLEWVEENPDEVWAMREAEAAKAMEKLHRERERLERAKERELRRATRRAERTLEAVPF